MYSHSSSLKLGAVPPKPVGLLERVREVARYKHYSIRTEQVYVEWIRRFVQFHGKRHPREMGAAEVRGFLSWLAGTRDVAASTHHQALSALLFLFRDVLEVALPWLGKIERPKKPKRFPVVWSAEETGRLLALMEGVHGLMARLSYGTGMRLLECLRLRVKDIDFEQRQIVVRTGKGKKDRVTVLPDLLVDPLRVHLLHAHALWTADRAAGRTGVQMPEALARRYPNAAQSWAWFWVFPVAELSVEPRSGIE